MAPRKTRRPGQGFSLYDLQDDIATVVETLGDALSRQGVPVDRDSLLLSIQSVVKTIGMGSPSVDYGYSALASDDTEVPYSVSGDMIVIAHEYFQTGNKTEAVKMMLTAMGSEDFGQIAQGLLEMNRLAQKSNKTIFAGDDNEDSNTVDDDDETDDDDDTNDDESEDNETDDDNTDLSDEEIDDLVEDSENDVTADDKDNEGNAATDEENNEEADKEDQDEEQPETPPVKKPENTVEASYTSRVLANRLSLEGNFEGRKRAHDFIKRHGNL